jgi:hypothetical protein
MSDALGNEKVDALTTVADFKKRQSGGLWWWHVLNGMAAIEQELAVTIETSYILCVSTFA